ncbi:hypothetical protein [Streptomyces boncukensis]|uniref:Uncharacterized protein n=1 Tax=Streptomyces boncukensis TaxID=2711219 RepID=A0A6G4X115_9ACTN|nr:hypothetical protein [Streptomyces boncukensis]NGO71185.1 hypothetical protein [Streptomyces boncukensis]
MPQDDEEHVPAVREAGLRVEHRLRDLAERLDPASFELLLKVMSGVNAAFARRSAPIDIELTDQERELYTPALQREVAALLELARVPPDRVRTGGAEGPAAAPVSELPRRPGSSWPYAP